MLLTLAVTIGATTAVFSIVNGVLLEPLALPRAASAGRPARDLAPIRRSCVGPRSQRASFRLLARAHARSFDSMAVYRVLPANLTGAGEAMRITVARSSGSLFDVLRTPAALGRTLTLDDEPLGRRTSR